MSKIIMFTGNIAARKFSHENLVGRALVCLCFNFTVKIVNSLIFTSIFYMVPKKWGGGNFMIIQFCICKFKKKMFAVRKGPPPPPDSTWLSIWFEIQIFPCGVLTFMISTFRYSWRGGHRQNLRKHCIRKYFCGNFWLVEITELKQ